MTFQKALAGIVVACVISAGIARAEDADLKVLQARIAKLEAKNAELEKSNAEEAAKQRPLIEAAAAADAATSATANVTTGGTKVTLSGYVDYSFTYNFNAPSNHNNNLRVFDNDSDGYSMHLAELSFDALPTKPGEAGFHIDLAFGQDVRVFKSTDKFVWNSQARLNDFVDSDFKQAYIEYIVPIGCEGNKKGITLDMGKFTTWAGYETIEAADNLNSSRSFLFGYAIPFTHTGLRATYKVFDSDCNKWTVGAAILNGWDNVQDQNKSKTGAIYSDWTPTKWFEMVNDAYLGYETVIDTRDTFASALLAGNDPADPTTPGFAGLHTGDTFLGSLDGGRTRRLFDPQRNGQRLLLDTSLIFKPTFCGKQDWTFALNGDYGQENNAKWFGGAAYAKWQFAKKWYLGVRAEYFDDSDGARTGLPQKLVEGTVTLDFQVTEQLHSRLEFRHDQSDQGAFSDQRLTSPVAGPNLHSPFAKQFQNTYMASWLYKF